jgi:hypothetical protein
MRHRSAALTALLVAAILTGCAQTTVLVKTEALPRAPGEARVVLMPPDVELSELTVGGLLEPRAEWTQQAIAHVTVALQEELLTKRKRLVPYVAPADDPAEQHSENQILKLHDAVGGAIIVHKLLPNRQLPTKEGKFDWTLGEGVMRLRERHDAHYALFVVFRDSYASPGRVAFMVGAALLGVGVRGGTQVGFASLVDLRNGDVVWFNRLIDPAGDLRTLEPARQAVKSLLADLAL